MNVFNETIAVGYERLNFVFTLILTPTGRKYFVTVYGKKGKVAFFDISRDKFGKWKIVKPAPDWVNGIEAQLLGAIKRHS